jgi:hypothetical protein
MSTKKKLSPEQRDELLKTLKTRFEKNMNRHKSLDWTVCRQNSRRILKNYGRSMKWKSPAVSRMWLVMIKKRANTFFMIVQLKVPKGRRSICYDHEALESRKEHKPEDSAVNMAADIGIEILTEEQYRDLQKLGNFDTKTSSWIATPPAIRKLGGAVFCDRRYATVFLYHNGAESYYAARGFRGSLRV